MSPPPWCPPSLLGAWSVDLRVRKSVTVNELMSPTISPNAKWMRVWRSHCSLVCAIIVNEAVAPVENSMFTAYTGLNCGVQRRGAEEGSCERHWSGTERGCSVGRGSEATYLVVADVVVTFVYAPSVRPGLECSGDVLDVGYAVNED